MITGRIPTSIKQNTSELFLFAIAIIVLAAEKFMPIVSNKVNAISVTILLAIVSVVIISKTGSNKFLSLVFGFLPAFIVEATNIIISFISGEGVGTDIFVFLKLILWPIIIWYVIHNNKKKLAIAFLISITAIYLITSITTQIGATLFPNICRTLANSGERTEATIALAKEYNIASFSFIYSVVLLIPICVYMLLNKTLNKVLVFTIILTFVLMILSAAYTTALLLTAASALLLFIPRNFKIKTLLLYLLLGCLILYLMRELIGDLFVSISNFVENRSVSNRFYDMGATLKGGFGNTESDLDNRRDLWLLDIDLFWQNPILGSFKSGGHSYILDKISQIGLLGIAIVVIEFSSIFKFFIKPYSASKIYSYVCFAFCLQIGLSILNPILCHEIFVIFVPLVAYVFEDLQFSVLKNRVKKI